jgi:hypothetical protein
MESLTRTIPVIKIWLSFLFLTKALVSLLVMIIFLPVTNKDITSSRMRVLRLVFLNGEDYVCLRNSCCLLKHVTNSCILLYSSQHSKYNSLVSRAVVTVSRRPLDFAVVIGGGGPAGVRGVGSRFVFHGWEGPLFLSHQRFLVIPTHRRCLPNMGTLRLRALLDARDASYIKVSIYLRGGVCHEGKDVRPYRVRTTKLPRSWRFLDTLRKAEILYASNRIPRGNLGTNTQPFIYHQLS